MESIFKPSPNFDERTRQPDMIILHYTGMSTGKAALERLCNPASKVSAHYLVERNGQLYKLVDEDKRAWHAGVSHWRGREGINDYSIGIEIVNKGHEHGYEKFTDEQYKTVIELCKELTKKYNIPGINIVGHSDIAPNRKQDPGEYFEWKRLAQSSLGAWVENKRSNDKILFKLGDVNDEIKKIQEGLKFFGYKILVNGRFDKFTELAVIAFQRHFDQQRFDGAWTERTEFILQALLNLLGKTRL